MCARGKHSLVRGVSSEERARRESRRLVMKRIYVLRATCRRAKMKRLCCTPNGRDSSKSLWRQKTCPRSLSHHLHFSEKHILTSPRLDHDLFATTVDINLSGAFYVCQAAARQMSTQPRGGSIIGISSISALVGGGQQTHYTPTKAGVLSLMQSMAVALGKYKIRCNALLPGTIKTQLNEEDLADEAKRTYMEGRIPAGRTGVPEDMAGPAVFLACEELSGYVNGAQLLVDGGMFVNLQ